MNLQILPLEITLQVASCSSDQDIKCLRSVSKFWDTILLETFSKRHFQQLYLIPTTQALDILAQIAKSGRVGRYVSDLKICCSIYQFYERFFNEDGSKRTLSSVTNTRMLGQDDLPYSEPTSLLQDAANESTSLLRSELLGKQLALAFQNLQVQRIEIHARLRKAAPDPAPGLSHLVQQTGRDPFKDVLVGVKPSWEYRTTDMITCLTQQVINALLQSQMPTSALVTDRFQSDRLTFCPTLLASSQDLKSLTHLVLRIGLCNGDPIAAESANQNPEFDLFTLVNNLPCLEDLSLASGPKLDKDQRPKFTKECIRIGNSFFFEGSTNLNDKRRQCKKSLISESDRLSVDNS